jgi:A/G-specific adenine glycosylase
MSHPFNSSHLKKWFLAERRELPWRSNTSPYSVWVSEVMLQQTQVSVVIPYYERWMQTFPSIESLASASTEQVMKSWEGLGYYSRARNLHDGAKFLCENYAGVFPKDHKEWVRIKGLGPYTIGAIRSFAFHQKAPVVDGNVIRVIARYFNLQDDISKSATLRNIWEIAAHILPEEDHWIHNEALIELGATLCSRNPQCQICPLKADCIGYAKGTANALPFNSRKITSTTLHRAVAVVATQTKLLLKLCGSGEIMAGLHEFPYVEMSPQQNVEVVLRKLLEKEFKLSVSQKALLSKVSHTFTRFQSHLYPILFETAQETVVEGFKWASLEEVGELAFSSGHRKVLGQLQSHLTPKLRFISNVIKG